jgi:hypothetical protein
MLDAYNEVRAALGWVRRKHKDADEIAPSMSQVRASAAKRGEGDNEPAPEPAKPVEPVGPVTPRSLTGAEGEVEPLPDAPFEHGKRGAPVKS